VNMMSSLQRSSAPVKTTGFVNAAVSLAVLAAMLIRLPSVIPNQLVGIATILAEVTTGLMGFMIAAMAILLTLGDSSFIQNLRKTGHFKVLLRGMLHATLSCFVALVIMIVCLLAPATYLALGLAIGVSVLALGLLFILQAGGRFAAILDHLH